MTLEDVYGQIRSLEKQKAETASQLEGLREDIVKYCCKYFYDQIKILIDENAEAGLLKDLKIKMEDLQQKSDNIVRDLFNEKNVLHHENFKFGNMNNPDGYQNSRHILNIVKGVLQNASSYISKILLEYGYLDSEYSGYEFGWEKDYSNGTVFYAKIGKDIPVTNYANKYADYLRTLRDLRKYNEEKEKLEAAELWKNEFK